MLVDITKIMQNYAPFFSTSVFVSVCVFNLWPETTLLPVCPRDTKRLDTPALKQGYDIIRDKEGHYIMIKERIQWEDITLVNIYADTIGAPKYIKQNLTDMKGDINSNTV